MDSKGLIPLCERASYLSNRLQDNNKKARCLAMIDTLLDNSGWPDLKIGGWLEHITTVCIENGVTTIDEERDYTRGIKHAYYQRMGYTAPETINLGEAVHG